MVASKMRTGLKHLQSAAVSKGTLLPQDGDETALGWSLRSSVDKLAIKCNLFAIIWWLSGAIYICKILTLNFANSRNGHKRLQSELNQNPRIIDLKQKFRNSSTNTDKVTTGQQFKCKITLGNLAFIFYI